MRSVILLVFGLGMLCGGVPSQMTHAQSDGGIVQLSSSAYGPDSPVQENRLFRYQTSRYGFAYNCDGEEDKRNHPAIAWQAADGEILPKRMGCLARVRHEVAQVSRRILDGMCDTGGCNCQQKREPTCACSKCVVQQRGIESTVVAGLPVGEHVVPVSDVVGPVVAETVRATRVAQATGRRSGLVRLTSVESVQSNQEIVAGDQHVDSAAIEYVKPPVARITSAMTAEVATGTVPSDSHQLSLLERLKIIQSLQASDATKVKKF